MNLILGPILGHVTQSTARLWAHTDQPAQNDSAISCEIFFDPDATHPVPGSPFRLEILTEMGLTGVCEVTLPKPNHRYFYRLFHNGKLLHDEQSYTFMTL